METTERDTIYYKYRSLENFEFFVDILVNNRLYAASYKDMNDTMEGVYYAYGLEQEIKNKIHDKKLGLKICSLSKSNNNPLMWAHYANGSQGVAFGLKINKDKYEVTDIKYTDILEIQECVNTQKTAKEILSHKHRSWKYEEETRVFTNKNYVDVKIVEIILGERIKPRHEKLIKSIVEKLKIKCLIRKQESQPSFSLKNIY